jgi:hypothetical protein
MLATPNLARQDRIQSLCHYAHDLDRLTLLKNRSIHLHDLNGSDVYLVQLVIDLYHELQTHSAAYRANAILYSVNDTQESSFLRDVILGNKTFGNPFFARTPAVGSARRPRTARRMQIFMMNCPRKVMPHAVAREITCVQQSEVPQHRTAPKLTPQNGRPQRRKPGSRK